MLQSYDGISDLNFSVGRPLQVEAFGQLKPIAVDPPIDSLTPYQTENIALNIMGNNRRLIEHLLDAGSCDCGYQLGTQARFRVNIFRQQGRFSVVMRKLNSGHTHPRQPRVCRTIFQHDLPRKNRLWSSSPAPPAPARRPPWLPSSTRSTAPRPTISLPWKTRSSSSIRITRAPSTSANSARISTPTPTACAPPCAKPQRSSSSAKCVTARRSKSP